jgi:hypothetical protein
MTPTVVWPEAMLVTLVDQIVDLELSAMTMFPSLDIVRRDDSGLETGESLFATHTGVLIEILLYHMPMYQYVELPVEHQGNSYEQWSYETLLGSSISKGIEKFLFPSLEYKITYVCLCFDK